MTLRASTAAGRRARARAAIMKALAHPARVLMVEELAAGPRCVRDLRAIVGSDLSTVSRHLALLRGAGLLATEKRGLHVFYRLTCACVVDFFACAERVLKTQWRAQARVLGTTPRAGGRRGSA